MPSPLTSLHCPQCHLPSCPLSREGPDSIFPRVSTLWFQCHLPSRPSSCPFTVPNAISPCIPSLSPAPSPLMSLQCHLCHLPLCPFAVPSAISPHITVPSTISPPVPSVPSTISPHRPLRDPPPFPAGALGAGGGGPAGRSRCRQPGAGSAVPSLPPDLSSWRSAVPVTSAAPLRSLLLPPRGAPFASAPAAGGPGAAMAR